MLPKPPAKENPYSKRLSMRKSMILDPATLGRAEVVASEPTGREGEQHVLRALQPELPK